MKHHTLKYEITIKAHSEDAAREKIKKIIGRAYLIVEEIKELKR